MNTSAINAANWAGIVQIAIFLFRRNMYFQSLVSRVVGVFTPRYMEMAMYNSSPCEMEAAQFTLNCV